MAKHARDRSRARRDQDAAGREVAGAPGKRTLVATDTTPDAASAVPLFTRSLDQAQAHAGRLELALAEVDAHRAMTEAGALQGALASAGGYLDAMRASDRVRYEASLTALAARVAPLLARAPQPTGAAMQAGLAGSWTRWDHEIETWRTARRVARLPSDAGAIAASGQFLDLEVMP